MEEIKETDLEIRPVTPDDFDVLTDISKICFPEQLRWKATKSHNRKWWAKLINSQCCEIWVGSINGRVIAYFAFAFDRVKYLEIWARKHYSISDCILMFLSGPKEFFRTYLSKLNLHKLNKRKDAESSADNSKLQDNQKIRKFMIESNPWCGPTAVLPDVRGQGISLKLMKCCFQRAMSHGYKEIYTAIEKKNIMSRIMSTIVGYKVIDEVDYLIFYKKALDNSDDSRVSTNR